ncbi:nickel transporter permease [Pseudalkalibacillus sp. Hm43]|uniref:nickel transporter permease n=1 Tax=Pseudalkalibacillus sp. Hm43 TaxID=3450742 RepID=UPI003F42DC41
MTTLTRRIQTKWNPFVLTGGFLLIMIVGIILGIPLWTEHDPYTVNTGERLLPSSLEHPLGTDQLGRDILARIAEGATYTLGISFVAILVSLLIGLPLGMISGFLGKKMDQVLMRIIDSFVAFPDFLVAIVITALLGPGIWNVLMAIVFVKWVGYARLARGIVLTEKHKDYITISKLSGSSVWKTITLHLSRHVLAPTIVLATLDMGKVILLISSLSYIGLGAQPPIPEWGTMLNEGRLYFHASPSLIIFPGLAIMLVVMAFNLIGDGIRDQLDGKRR